VFSDSGEAVAALAVVAPVERLPAERYGQFSEAVTRAAGRLSEALGHVPEAGSGDRARAA